MKPMANTISVISTAIQPADLQSVDQAAAAAAAAAAANAAAQEATQKRDEAATPSDRADLSGTAQSLGKALQKAGAQSSFNHGRVQELKVQIATGTYQPDPYQVAASVVNALNQGT